MKVRRTTCGIVAFGIFCIFLPNWAGAGKEITIVSSDYPPHIYMENDEIKGLRVELLTEIFNRMGYKYVPKVAPWSRAVFMVKEGEVDGICSIWYKPEREEFLHYPEYSYMLEVQAIYQRKGSKEIHYKSLEDFKGLRVGTIRGFAFSKDFLESTLFKIEPAATDKQNFRKLTAGRLDVVISDGIVGDYIVREDGLQDQVFRSKSNYNEGFWGYMAFSKKRPDGKHLAEEFDRVMKDLLREGFYSRFFWKHLNRPPDKLPKKRESTTAPR